MKVILIRDVAKLGRKSSVVEVPSGHALNFLIPKKMAIPATPDNVKRLAAETRKQATQTDKERELFLEAAKALESQNLIIAVDANEKGHLYKGVGIDDVYEALVKKGLSVQKRDIMLEQPIKSLGTHEVVLVHGEQKAVCHLEVVKR